MFQTQAPCWRPTQPRRQQICWHSCSRPTQQQPQQQPPHSSSRRTCLPCRLSPRRPMTGPQAVAEAAASCQAHQEQQLQQGVQVEMDHPGSSSSRGRLLRVAPLLSTKGPPGMAPASGVQTACLSVSLGVRSRSLGLMAAAGATVPGQLQDSSKAAGRKEASSSSSRHGSSMVPATMGQVQQGGQVGSSTATSSSSSSTVAGRRWRTHQQQQEARLGVVLLLCRRSLARPAAPSSSSCSGSTAMQAPHPPGRAVAHPRMRAVLQGLPHLQTRLGAWCRACLVATRSSST